MKKTFLKRALIAGALLLAPVIAFALNIDPTRNIVARINTTQQVNYYRFTINYNDRGISSGVGFGALLQNTFISNIACHVTTAFNAGSTNVVTVGITQSTPTELIAASGANASLTASSVTYQLMSASGGLGLGATSAANVNLYAKYTQTGTAATAGSVTCVIEYIPNNDM